MHHTKHIGALENGVSGVYRKVAKRENKATILLNIDRCSMELLAVLAV